MMEQLKLLQLNCRGARSKIEEIDQYVNAKCADIVCLNETKTNNSLLLEISNFSLVTFINCSKSTHGSAIFIRKNLKVSKICNPIEIRDRQLVLEILRVQIFFNDQQMCWISCVYNSPSMPLRTDLVFDENFYPCITVGDFNSPHANLRCSYNTDNGEKLCDLINSDKIILLNNGQHTFLHASTKTENMLDLHFTDSNEILSLFSAFYTDENLGQRSQGHNELLQCEQA